MLYHKQPIAPYFGQLSGLWKKLSSEEKEAYNKEADRVNAGGSSQDPKQVYASVKKVCKDLCKLPEVQETGTHLLILGCSTSGQPFVISSGAAVRSYFDRIIEPACGVMEMQDMASYKTVNELQVVNDTMSKDNIDKNLRTYFKRVYGELTYDVHACLWIP